jgi:hypothetical protein
VRQRRQFTDHGVVRLGIGCLAEDAESVALRFSVRIPVSALRLPIRRLFQPFTRRQLIHREHGHGLGLAISQYCRPDVRNDPGRQPWDGSILASVCLPRAIAAVTEAMQRRQ